MRRAGRPSWQIVVDHPQVLAIALCDRRHDLGRVAHVLASPALLRSPAALVAELRPVIQRLA